MSEQKQMTAAERFKAHMASREAEVVDVIAPSGFVYKFKKPSRSGLLFTMNSFPQAATERAIDSWAKDGLEDAGTEDAGPETPQLQLVQLAFKLRDRVLQLSHEPKLVVGPAKSETEVSTDDVHDDDLDYLLEWVKAGGETSALVGKFPHLSPANALASAGGKKRGAAAK